MSRPLAALAAACGLFSLATPEALVAQPLDNALFTVGTSVKDAQNQDWAFLLFQLTAEPQTLLGRRLAIYAKPGNFDDPGEFTRTAIVSLQVDPLVIKALLNRAAALGQSPGDLNVVIDELFGALVPAPHLPVEEKLSAVIRGSLDDPALFANLLLLARLNPGVSLSLGLAHAQRIGAGRTTFEVREVDPFGTDFGVVGRVLVDAAAPVVLPAPGAPVAVPDTSPKGHLNARLRWAIPDGLRRLALLQYGFNVYRVPRAFAENLGWDGEPPESAALALLADAQAEGVRRVNRAPVLPTALFDAVSVLDLASDPDTAFMADDNFMSDEGSVRFRDGERFYYFVTARDILGRDGLSSPGTQVLISDRVPPHPPRRPEVVNAFAYVAGTEKHHLQVEWNALPNTPEAPISGYYVYRWASPADVQKYAAQPAYNRISSFIPQPAAGGKITFLDDGEGSPTVPESYDHTYWYTIRAVKPTALGGNLSPHSGPAFGVLRQRTAPDAPDGEVFVTCCLPTVVGDRIEPVDSTAATDPLRSVLDLICVRQSRMIAWVEFALQDEREPSRRVGRYHFPWLRNQVRHRIDLSRRMAEAEGTLRVFCRVGDAAGNVSAWTSLEQRGVPDRETVWRFVFFAGDDCTETLLDASALAAGCDGHAPGNWSIPGGLVIPEDGKNPSNPIKVTFDLKARAGEYRVYRRVDTGSLTLWKQGLADEAVAQKIVLEDGALPPNAGEVSYFGQFLDENGNASELKLLGQHVAVKQPAPTPMLSPPEIDESEGAPRVKLRWFCPPHGVERFELILGVEPGPIPTSLIPLLSNNVNTPMDNQQFANNDGGEAPAPKIKHGAYRTPAIAGGFGPGPEYEVTIPVNKTGKYQFQIRAVAKYGAPYGYSNVYKFEWPAEDFVEATGPMVPWPARAAPAPTQAAPAGVAAVRLTEGHNGLGVVIGSVPSDQIQNFQLLGSDADIRDYLLPVAENGPPVLPAVLYRYQVANSAFPSVSGDLIQVTPLMEKIATVPTASNTREIRDPFVRLLNPGTGGAGLPWKIVLLDTQPAVRTSSYAYVLVRFRADGEIDSVHPVAPITVQ